MESNSLITAKYVEETIRDMRTKMTEIIRRTRREYLVPFCQKYNLFYGTYGDMWWFAHMDTGDELSEDELAEIMPDELRSIMEIDGFGYNDEQIGSLLTEYEEDGEIIPTSLGYRQRLFETTLR